MSTAGLDRLRPTTTVTVKTVDGDHAFKRLVLRRYPLSVSSPSPIITHTEEHVENTHEDGPFNDYGRRVIYRSEPKAVGNEEVDWLDEYLVDTISCPGRPRNWHDIIEWPLPPDDKTMGGEDLEIERVPFLSWPLTRGKDERTPEEVEKTLVSILSKMNKTLSNGVVARLYFRVFKCTMKDLLHRHDFLLATPHGNGTTSPVETPGVGDTDQDTPKPGPSKGDENGDADINSSQSPSDSSNQDEAGTSMPSQATHQPAVSDSSGIAPMAHSDSTQKGQTRSIHATKHDGEIMKRLFDVSKDIFGAYVPDQGSPLIHHVCVRFWGAVDDIFRVGQIPILTSEVKG